MAQYFNLTLDTTAPSGGVFSNLQSYYKENKAFTISASGASYMKVWFNQNATATISDADVPANWEAYSTSDTTNFTAQGTNYIHAVFMDEVGNIGQVVNSVAVVFDSIAPTKPAAEADVLVADGASVIGTQVTTVKVSVADATSGVDAVVLGGDIIINTTYPARRTLNATDKANGYIICTIMLTSGDGNKVVTAKAVDTAGNESIAVAGNTVELDTTPATANLYLRKSDDSAALPSYVNAYGFAFAIETTESDIVSYKYWGDITGHTTEPSSWSEATFVSGRMLITDQTFTSGEGLKTVNVKIKDRVGNESTLDAKSATVDLTPPTVTLSAAPTVISSVSGYNSVTFTGSATDAHDLTNYKLMLGSTQIKSGSYGTGVSVSVTASEIEAISAGQGTKTFTLVVADIATNEGTSSAITVSLDKTAPTGSVTASTYYTSTSVGVTVAATDTGGGSVAKMKVWLDNTEPTSWSDFASGTFTFSSVTEGKHKAHVKFMDSVGNASAAFDSSDFIVDTTPPHIDSTSVPAYTTSTTFTFSFNASDTKSGVADVSGIASMKIWQSGQSEPGSYESYVGSKTLTLVGADGSKTIYGKFKDNAGNESLTLTIGTTILDTDAPDAQIVLFKEDGTTPLPAKVNLREFVAHLASTDVTQTTPITQYKLYGDFDQASTEWKTYTLDSGKSYMTVDNLTLTIANGLKTITLVLKDAAGNESSAISAIVTYDTVAPVIDVTNPDYNIVSKQHTSRLAPNGSVIAGKYNDVSIFTFSCSKKLAEYKVCVNESGQTAVGAVAIGTTHGSQNMTGTNVEADTDITCTIMGADFAATSAVNETDGAYEIIVYGKDEAGTWSAVHVLNN